MISRALFSIFLFFSASLPAMQPTKECGPGVAKFSIEHIASELHRLENVYLSLDLNAPSSVHRFVALHRIKSKLAEAPIDANAPRSPRTIRWLKQQIDAEFAELVEAAYTIANTNQTSGIKLEGTAAYGNDGPLFWVSGEYEGVRLPQGTLLALVTPITTHAIAIENYLELLKSLEAARVGPEVIALANVPGTLVRGILYTGLDGYCPSADCPRGWHAPETVFQLHSDLEKIRAFPWEKNVVGGHVWRNRAGLALLVAPIINGDDSDQSDYRNHSFDTVSWSWRFERDHELEKAERHLPTRRKLTEQVGEIRRTRRELLRLAAPSSRQEAEFGSFPASIAIMGELCDHLEDVGNQLIASLHNEDAELTEISVDRRRAITVAYFESRRTGGPRVSVIDNIPYCEYIPERELQQWFYWLVNSPGATDNLPEAIPSFLRLYHTIHEEWQIPYHPHFRSLHYPFLQ